jgi:hypothetical protein
VVDGKRTAATGPHAAHVQAVLQRSGVACAVLGAQAYRQRMVEKLL